LLVFNVGGERAIELPPEESPDWGRGERARLGEWEIGRGKIFILPYSFN
jgi:hypothetical protein